MAESKHTIHRFDLIGGCNHLYNNILIAQCNPIYIYIYILLGSCLISVFFDLFNVLDYIYRFWIYIMKSFLIFLGFCFICLGLGRIFRISGLNLVSLHLYVGVLDLYFGVLDL